MSKEKSCNTVHIRNINIDNPSEKDISIAQGNNVIVLTQEQMRLLARVNWMAVIEAGIES